MSTIYCPSCGTQNDSSARFCDACGRSLADVNDVQAATRPTMRGDQKDAQGRLLGVAALDDGVLVPQRLISMETTT